MATTTRTTTSSTSATTTNCYQSGTCTPDPEGAVSAIRAAIGDAYVTTGKDMPEVFIPQYTSITPAAVVSPGNDQEVEQSTVQGGIVIRMDRFVSVEVEP
ncbi:hypothetical protein FOZ63_023623, partial [Perkinsus olseni]